MALRYKINSIKTLRFETNDTVSGDNGKMEVGVTYRFREPNFIALIGDFRFFAVGSDKESLSMSAEIEYDIHPQDFVAIKSNENIITLPQKIAQLFSNMVIGTARGILHVRTENTKFSHFIIPPVTFSKSIESDVVINVKQ